VKSFTDGLLSCKPALPGLDSSVVIAPRRLHITLGVMALEDPLASSNKTLANALALLSTLRPRVMEILNGHCLCIPLMEMNIMKPHCGDAENAHVLWFGPSLNTEDGQRLKTVSGTSIVVALACLLLLILTDFVNKAFLDAGFILDRRPLKVRPCSFPNLMATDVKSAPLHNSKHFASQTAWTTIFIQSYTCITDYS
jgi:activating signal cointegrator complex subunit 1